MKKTISKSMAWLLSVVMIFGVFISSANILTETSLTVNAVETQTCGDYNYTVNSDNTVTITKSHGSGGKIAIPSVIDGKSVTSIGDWAFSDCTSLTSVTIPDSVTSIRNGAFSGCTSLTSVTIPDSVTSIGGSAFRDCTSLTSVTIPDSVTSIGDYAFSGCKSLTSVTIPDSVTSIGDYAFSSCTGLTSITIPNSVTSIGDKAFFGCTILTSITIPSSVTSIRVMTFSHCSSLTSINVDINNSAYSSENGVLFNKNKTIILTYPTGKKGAYSIPNSVTSIGNLAFYYCPGLTSITIPNGVTSIEDWAFSGCTGLTSVNIPNSVTSIGDHAFSSCPGLTSITIPNSVTSIGNYAFSDCPGLTSITIPNSVTSIGDKAFLGCTILTSITIPNSVTSIGDGAFFGCTGLTSITIPNSVTSIGNETFANCDGLTSITIPNSVTSIGDKAFLGCTILTSITIPNSVTSIGDYAFYDCTGLTSITIPNSVTSIGDWAFTYCSGLKDVYYTGTEEEWQKIKIGSSNKPLSKATIHFNYRKADTEINADQYRFYFDKNPIVPGDTFIVGADKLGGNYTGTYYPGPGKVEWEISNRDVIDFVPITGRTLPYYEDSTQLHLKAKNFGESTLTLNLNGKTVCSETITVTLSDELLGKEYRQYITYSTGLAGFNNAVNLAVEVLGELSFGDMSGITGYSFMNADYFGLGIPLGYVYNFISTGELYSRNDDEVLYRLLANYYGLKEHDNSEFVDHVKNIYNYIAYNKNGLTNADYIVQLFSNTQFDVGTISKSLEIGGDLFDVAGNLIDYGVSKQDVATTILLISQFELDVVNKLQTCLYVAGDNSSSMMKAIERLKKHIADPKRFKNEEEKKILFETLANIVYDKALDMIPYGKILSVIESFHKLLGGYYESIGGITLDDLNNMLISLNSVEAMSKSMKNSSGISNIHCAFDFNKAAVLTMLDYTNVIIEGKTGIKINNDKLKKHKTNYNNVRRQVSGCEFSRIIQEASESAKNIESSNLPESVRMIGAEIRFGKGIIVSPMKSKSTGSGASTINAEETNTNDILFIPANYSGYDIVKISDGGYRGVQNTSAVIFPDTVREIGNYAFADCKSIQSVCLNEKLESIGDYAFSGCTSLNSIILPTNVKHIGINAFVNCSDIEYISLNSDDIGDKAFANCTSLSEVRFNNRETVIGKNVFAGCSDDLIISGYKNSTAEQYAKANHIAFEVIPEYVASIKIVSPANKKEYTVGEEVDTAGLKIKTVYKDGSSETLTDGWITAYNTSLVGDSSVTIIYGEKSTSYKINVSKGEDPAVSLDTTNIKMLYGTGTQLHADITSPNGLTPTITYSSSNPAVAQVSSTGYIRALKPGKAQITAGLSNADIKAVCKVTVTNTESFNTAANDNVVYFTPTNDNYYLLTISSEIADTNIGIYDESQNEVSKTAIDHNQWRVILAANTLYTIIPKAAKSIRIDECTVSSDVQIISNSGTPVTELTANVGDKIDLSAQAINNNSIEDEYYWESDNNSIASVSNEGKITCNTEGNTTLRLTTSHFVTKEIPITVNTLKPLSNTSEISSASIAIGDSIKITGAAEGGTQPYKFGVYYKKSSSSEWMTAQSYKENTTVTIKPAAAVKYDICVKVKDKTGKVKEKYFTVNVIRPLTNTSSISADSVIKGKAVTITAKASGGTAPYTYSVSYKTENETQWKLVQSFTSNTSVTIMTTDAVKYSICVKVKDKTGAIEKKYFTVNVTEPLKNTSTVSATTVMKNSPITVSAKASGGTSPYQYAFYYSYEGGTAKTLKAYSSSSKATFPSSETGKYNIIVKIKDAEGKIAKKDFDIVVYDKSYQLKSRSKISATQISLGNKVKITADAEGGTGYYQYAFYYRTNGTSDWKTIRTYGSENTVYFKPAYTGSYELLAKVKDSNGKIVKTTFSLTVEDANKKIQFDADINRTVVYAGQALEIDVTASGGTGFYKYGFYLKKTTDTEWTTVQAFSPLNKAVFSLPASGEYEICVKVKDSSESSTKKYYNVTSKPNVSAIRNLSTVSAKTIALGETVKMTGAYSGKASYIEYLMVYRMAGEEEWIMLQNYGANNTVIFKPDCKGTYELCIKVSDFDGANEEKRFTLIVN